MVAMKAKEKEMKDEKEEERQVRQKSCELYKSSAERNLSEAYTSYQRQEGGERREGAI